MADQYREFVVSELQSRGYDIKNKDLLLTLAGAIDCSLGSDHAVFTASVVAHSLKINVSDQKFGRSEPIRKLHKDNFDTLVWMTRLGLHDICINRKIFNYDELSAEQASFLFPIVAGFMQEAQEG